ncbi:ATP-binding protein involved in chromosome partitioning [Quadrisphaera granulorum]|uniref:Iron-sulfur cluster carrier protein n=1 Tax=Quadrisphaera granulorum TaxID=317664 RepID=A0A316AF13_9ACTN|nr:ATP-binding protein involved in chromosome partitioning [Quadrisphaera granulorum]SZE94825.1 ATP-binding protein involved in chromosome partitioning [Quadrisphaera granulorum]
MRAALSSVLDPEIRRPITELGMVSSLEVSAAGAVVVEVLLTTSGCPLRDTLQRDVTEAVSGVEGVSAVQVELGVMNDEQRSALRGVLRGQSGSSGAERDVPFARPGSLTRVYCVASGKGGVGKSTLTVNLAVAMARDGLRVGLVDADVHGFSVPGLLGATGRPVKIDDVVIPPVAHGVKVISMGMVVPDGQPVMHRGPLLHRALQQFLTEVHFGDLDVLLLDMPPGTGDVPISAAQLLPGSELLVVTTPQPAAAEVAHRSGGLAARTGQGVVGVVENMSWMPMPDGSRLEVFGSGGGAAVAERLSRDSGTPVPLLAQVPLDVAVREGGDAGTPVVLAAPDSPAAVVLSDLARTLGRRARGLAGRPLGVVPA